MPEHRAKIMQEMRAAEERRALCLVEEKGKAEADMEEEEVEPDEFGMVEAEAEFHLAQAEEVEAKYLVVEAEQAGDPGLVVGNHAMLNSSSPKGKWYGTAAIYTSAT